MATRCPAVTPRRARWAATPGAARSRERKSRLWPVLLSWSAGALGARCAAVQGRAARVSTAVVCVWLAERVGRRALVGGDHAVGGALEDAADLLPAGVAAHALADGGDAEGVRGAGEGGEDLVLQVGGGRGGGGMEIAAGGGGGGVSPRKRASGAGRSSSAWRTNAGEPLTSTSRSPSRSRTVWSGSAGGGAGRGTNGGRSPRGGPPENPPPPLPKLRRGPPPPPPPPKRGPVGRARARRPP